MQNKIVRKLVFAIKFFTTKRIIDFASALTYSTILSIVPICAVVFSIARGFGYTIYIEEWFRRLLSAQPQVAELIINFVNSYLEHTKSGVILGIGLVFMLYTVVMLTRNVELTFNDIWHVEDRKNSVRTFTDYLATFFIIPFVIIIMSGVTLLINTVASTSPWNQVLAPATQFLIDFIPVLLMWLMFVALYVFMPNTKVKVVNTLFPALLATLAMQALQWFYFNAQMFISNYNAIYGSFAALPLFMLWVQFSWTICLFGAELCYTNQKLEEFAFADGASMLSHRYKLLLSLVLMSKVCKRFAVGQTALTADDLQKQTNLPLSVVRDLLNMLTRANLLAETSRQKSSESYFQPAMSLDLITVGHVVDVLEAQGSRQFDIDLKGLVENQDMLNDLIDIRRRNIDNLDSYLVKDL